MNNNQAIKNQIAQNMEMVEKLKNTKDNINNKIAENNKKIVELRHDRIEHLTSYVISGGLFIAGCVLAVCFPLSVPAMLPAVASGACMCLSYIQAGLPQRKYNNLIKDNLKYTQDYTYFNDEYTKLVEQTEALNNQLNCDNKIKQNLQPPKVMHSKEFKQFKNYLKYKNSKVEQTTQEDNDEIGLNM